MKMLIDLGIGVLGKEVYAVKKAYDMYKRYTRKRRKVSRVKRFIKWIIKNPIKFGIMVTAIYMFGKTL